MKPVEAQLKQIKKEFEKKKRCDPKKLDLGNETVFTVSLLFLCCLSENSVLDRTFPT